MPLNYRKNNTTYSVTYHDNISDLDDPNVLQTGRMNVQVAGATKYIGLISTGADPTNESDIRVRRSGVTYSLAKNSLALPNIIYDGDNIASQNVGSVSYTPTLSGKYISSITATSLPSGTSINSSTGAITGTISSAGTYTPQVTITNPRGSKTNTFTLNVSDIVPSGLSYPNNYVTPQVSTSQTYTPTLSQGTNVTYSISPALNNSLSFNTSNGVISGTLSGSPLDTTYTVTATNTAGSTSTTIRIRSIYYLGTLSVGASIIDSYDPGTNEYSTQMGYAQANRGNFGSMNPLSYRGTTIEGLIYNEFRNGSYVITATQIIFYITGNQPSFNRIVINSNNVSTTGFAGTYYTQYISNQNATQFFWSINNSTFSWFRSLYGTTTSVIIE